MNVLWVSNSSTTNSGYGNQTDLFTPRVRDAGMGVVVAALYGCEGKIFTDPNNITTLPRGKDLYLNDMIQAHMDFNHWDNGEAGDVAISLFDPFVFDANVWSKFRWAAWVPVDGAPLFPRNAAALLGARWVWSMSRFGHEALTKAGFQPRYVPHGIDTKQYAPKDRSSARSALGKYIRQDLADKYLVVSVAANKGTPSRKNFVGMIEAFSLFVKGNAALDIEPHPDALFYIHSEPLGVWGGEDIAKIAHAFDVADKVITPHSYHVQMSMHKTDFMNNVYNAADVFMLLSSEGFGIPTVEAQAAGCPVIVSDYSASPELCFGGWTVPGMRKYMALTGVFWYEPIVPLAARSLGEAYEKRGDTGLREKARMGALAFDVDQVFTQFMLPALQEIQMDIDGAAQTVMDRRRRRRAVREIQPRPRQTLRGEHVAVTPEPMLEVKIKYSILMLTHNRLSTMQACWRSLEGTRRRTDVEFIILDNASADGTPEWLFAQQGERVCVERSLENLGVAKGRNMLSRMAHGDILIFLDSDTIIEDEGWLATLTAPFEHENIGVVGCAGCLVRWELPLLFTLSPRLPGLVDVVSGWCLAARREVFQGAAFDEDYGLFHEEDSDFCMQARRHGYDVWGTGYIGVQHTPGNSGSEYSAREKTLARFRLKWQERGYIQAEGWR